MPSKHALVMQACSANSVAERAESRDANLNRVAALHGADARRRTRCNNIARQQCHALSDVTNQLVDTVHHGGNGGMLNDFAVKQRRISAVSGLNSVSIYGPVGQKVSKPLPRVHWGSDF